MSVDEEKKTFVMKHTFIDVKNMKDRERHYGNKSTFYNIPWNIYVYLYKSPPAVDVLLACRKFRGPENWSIETTTIGELVNSTGEKLPVKNHVFSNNSLHAKLCGKKSIQEYLVDGNLTIECHVTINKIIGTDTPIFRSFDDELAKQFSDIVLRVKDWQFHVNKMYLATHSTYFKALLCGNFSEAEQSEVELKAVDSYRFYKFLETLYGEPAINDYYVPNILKLSDMFNAKTVIRQCEQFYLHRSQKSLKHKFSAATEYNLDQLLEKCISEMKTVEDIEQVIPEDDNHIDKSTSMKLLKMSIEFYKKK